MANWKLAARALYSIGSPASAVQVSEITGDTSLGAIGLQAAKRYGLAVCSGRRGCWSAEPPTWRLTQKGIDYCEGRVDAKQGAKVAGGDGGFYRWRPTWLAALPRGVRIEPGPLQLAAAA